MIRGKEVTCRIIDADPRIEGFQDRDRYGRPVARCAAGGKSLEAGLLARGVVEAWGA